MSVTRTKNPALIAAPWRPRPCRQPRPRGRRPNSTRPGRSASTGYARRWASWCASTTSTWRGCISAAFLRASISRPDGRYRGALTIARMSSAITCSAMARRSTSCARMRRRTLGRTQKSFWRTRLRASSSCQSSACAVPSRSGAGRRKRRRRRRSSPSPASSASAIRMSCGRRGSWRAMRANTGRRQGMRVWPFGPGNGVQDPRPGGNQAAQGALLS